MNILSPSTQYPSFKKRLDPAAFVHDSLKLSLLLFFILFVSINSKTRKPSFTFYLQKEVPKRVIAFNICNNTFRRTYQQH